MTVSEVTGPSSSGTPFTNKSISSEPVNDSKNSQAPSHASIPTKRRNDGSEVAPINGGLGLKSQIFHIWVGDDPVRFSVHEHYLAKSPKLKSMCTAIKLKRGNSKMSNMIVLHKESPVSIGYLLEYLYFNTLDIPRTDSLDEGKRLADLHSLAIKFQLNDFASLIIKKFELFNISSSIPSVEFLKLIEDMYLEEDALELNKYFVNIAPDIVRSLKDSDFSEIERMVGEGGRFATALFAAFRKAFEPKGVQKIEEKPVAATKKDLDPQGESLPENPEPISFIFPSSSHLPNNDINHPPIPIPVITCETAPEMKRKDCVNGEVKVGEDVEREGTHSGAQTYQSVKAGKGKVKVEEEDNAERGSTHQDVKVENDAERGSTHTEAHIHQDVKVEDDAEGGSTHTEAHTHQDVKVEDDAEGKSTQTEAHIYQDVKVEDDAERENDADEEDDAKVEEASGREDAHTKSRTYQNMNAGKGKVKIEEDTEGENDAVEDDPSEEEDDFSSIDILSGG